MSSTKRSARVLVADDDVEVRELLEQMLAIDGHMVVTAQDGAEAIALLAGGAFDIVVSDVEMPLRDGFMVAEAARSCAAPPLVVLMSGLDRRILAARVRRSRESVVRVLAKPFCLDELRVLVGRALKRAK